MSLAHPNPNSIEREGSDPMLDSGVLTGLRPGKMTPGPRGRPLLPLSTMALHDPCHSNQSVASRSAFQVVPQLVPKKVPEPVAVKFGMKKSNGTDTGKFWYRK